MTSPERAARIDGLNALDCILDMAMSVRSQHDAAWYALTDEERAAVERVIEQLGELVETGRAALRQY